MMNTRCIFCVHKNLQDSQKQYIYGHNDKFLIVNDLPCLQCTYCGEQYSKRYVLKNIEKKFNEIHLHGHKASQEIHIPVEHFFDLQQA